MADYEIGADVGMSRDIQVEERYMRPTPDYPQGSYLRKVDNRVEIATGFYAIKFPDKPSLYWHGGPPFFVIDTGDWPWRSSSPSDKSRTD